MQIAGAQRNPFRRSAMNALFQRSQGIPRLINIIADRSLIAAFAKERLEVTAAMVHEAANEVQLGERQVKRVRWPLWLGATAATAVAVLAVATFTDFHLPAGSAKPEKDATVLPAVEKPVLNIATVPPIIPDRQEELVEMKLVEALDNGWLEEHQQLVWQGLADMWNQPGAAFTIHAACNGDNSLGYACLRDQGNWLKINRLGLPVVLVLQEETPAYLLLQGVDADRLLVGTADQSLTVSRESVESRWLGTYLVAWPQAAGWPPFIGLGDKGPAVATIMEMATRVDDPYTGEQVFDAAFELWLKNFQIRNGLDSDGIVGRNTLLHLMTASIEEPKLLRTWE
jgi:general secretion pathway protein A